MHDMSRSAVAPLALGAVAIVAAAAWWIPLDPPSHAEPANGSPDEFAAAPLLLRPGVEGAEDAVVPDAIEDGHDGFDSANLYDYLNDPANSDLPADTFAEVTRLAADIVRADATGEGRHRWPDYWDTDVRADPCCAAVTILATGAYIDPSSTDAARVTVIWASEPHGERTTDLLLVRRDQTWRPVQPPGVVGPDDRGDQNLLWPAPRQVAGPGQDRNELIVDLHEIALHEGRAPLRVVHAFG
jgi:hypothetical protein